MILECPNRLRPVPPQKFLGRTKLPAFDSLPDRRCTVPLPAFGADTGGSRGGQRGHGPPPKAPRLSFGPPKTLSESHARRLINRKLKKNNEISTLL